MCFSFHLRLVIRVQKQEKAVGGPKEEKRVRGVSPEEGRWEEMAGKTVCHQAFLVCR